MPMFKKALFPILILALATACASKETDPGQDQQPGTNPDGSVTIRVTIPEETYSKVTLTEDNGSLKAEWEESDKIRVISGRTSEEYSLSRIVSPSVAEFTGKPVSGAAFDIVYPGNYASKEEALNDTQSPTQTGNGSTAHLRFKAIMESVNSYSDISLSTTWAESHGGIITMAPILQLVTRLPAGTKTVDKVAFSLNGKEYTLPLSGVDVSAQGQVLTAYMMLPCQNLAMPAGSVVSVYVTDPQKNTYSKQLTLSAGKLIAQGKVSTLAADPIVLTAEPFAGGEGTQSNPWLIANATHLNNMRSALVAGQTKYFRLVEDIDASTISNWQPFNAAAPFDKGINFDGDGHTISGLTSNGVTYASFAGVLYGDVHDVTFSNATITASSKCGVIAGFLGTCTNDYSRVATCTNVIVTNSTVSGTGYAGGFAGHVRGRGPVTGCKVINTTVNAADRAGGFAAQADITGTDRYEVPVIFTDCSVEGVTLNQKRTAAGAASTGGFVGHTAQAVSFIGCQVKGARITANLTAVDNVGGFVGGSETAGANFRECVVDAESSITAAGSYVGGFAGNSGVPDAFHNCSSAATVVNSGANTGGFVGYAFGSASFVGCTASGSLAAGQFSGGFAGTVKNASFTSCSYTGGMLSVDMSGSNMRCGGFVGNALEWLYFNDCHVTGAKVSAPNAGRTGGFVGQLGDKWNTDNHINLSHCSVSGTDVEGAGNTGGFSGVQYASVSCSSVTGGTVDAGADVCGGFCAYLQNGDVTHCYTSASLDGGSFGSSGGFVGALYDGSISFSYSAGSLNSVAGAFAGKCATNSSTNPGSISSSIAWNAALPFCASNEAGASITLCYAGTDGSVSAKAQELTWPVAVWNLNGPTPVLLPGSTRIPAVFVGDSITWQWASTGRTDEKSAIESATHGYLSLNPLPSYMTLSGTKITTRFHPEFFGSNSYIDKGISGQNTRQMRDRFQKDVIAINPQVLVLMAGTNDLAQGVSEDGIFENISYMASTALDAGIKVILCSITPNNRAYSNLSNPNTKGAHIEALNARFKALANSTPGYYYCDYWSALVSTGGDVQDPNDVGHGLKDKYRLYDDLHPGPDAYTVMESIVQPIIQGIIVP